VSEKYRFVKLSSQLAGPHGHHEPGDSVELPAGEAKQLIRGRYAVEDDLAAAIDENALAEEPPNRVVVRLQVESGQQSSRLAKITRDRAVSLVVNDGAEVLPWWLDTSTETPPEGFTPEVAFLNLTDRCKRAEYELLKQWDAPIDVFGESESFSGKRAGRARMARRELEDDFHARLRSGKLVARGHPRQVPLEAKRETIGAELWTELRFKMEDGANVYANTVEMDGLKIYLVRLFRAEDLEKDVALTEESLPHQEISKCEIISSCDPLPVTVIDSIKADRTQIWIDEARKLKSRSPDLSGREIAQKISKLAIADGRESETIRKAIGGKNSLKWAKKL
jgi:hypothetical protein